MFQEKNTKPEKTIIYPVCVICHEIILLTNLFLNDDYDLYISFNCGCKNNNIIKSTKFASLATYYARMSRTINFSSDYCIKCLTYYTKGCNHDKNYILKYKINQYTKHCSIHPSQIFAYYCEQCNKLICKECKKLHQKHPLITMSKLYQQAHFNIISNKDKNTLINLIPETIPNNYRKKIIEHLTEFKDLLYSSFLEKKKKLSFNLILSVICLQSISKIEIMQFDKSIDTFYSNNKVAIMTLSLDAPSNSTMIIPIYVRRVKEFYIFENKKICMVFSQRSFKRFLIHFYDQYRSYHTFYTSN